MKDFIEMHSLEWALDETRLSKALDACGVPIPRYEKAAVILAAEVERLNLIISRLSVEGQDAVEM